MGYFKIENFDNLDEWTPSTSTVPNVVTRSTDLEHLQAIEEKTTTIGLNIIPGVAHNDFVFEKNLSQTIYYKFQDRYQKPVVFDTLRVTYRAFVGHDVVQLFRAPGDFYMSFGIKFEGEVVREWFMPIKMNDCEYSIMDFDLKPLVDEAEKMQGFDTIFFRVLSNPGEVRIYFGECFLTQESDPTHNIKLALTDLLHLKKRLPPTELMKAVNQNDQDCDIKNSVDIRRGSSLLFTNGEDEELHVVASMDYYNKQDTVKTRLTFTKYFDGDKFLGSFPKGTRVEKVIPAVCEDLVEDDIVFPLFYIYNEAMITDEDNHNILPVIDNYVRDTVNGNKSAIRKGLNAVSMIASINVFADVPEIAQEMFDFLKGYVNTQSTLYVAGKPYQYVVSSERDIAPDESEALPHHVMELTFYFEHNVFERTYRPYPLYSNIEVDLGIQAVEEL